jgi:hypothetical protein
MPKEKDRTGAAREVKVNVNDRTHPDVSGRTVPRTHPAKAIVTGIAIGNDGDRVGVYGSTVSNVGVWGASYSREGLAGKFSGNVHIWGRSFSRGKFPIYG